MGGLLGVDFKEARARWRHKHLVFTGAVDEFYDRRFGPLPYRSLRFENESFSASQLREREPVSGKPGFWQPAMQVNYPDAGIPFTRIVEIKHATGQRIDATTIVREFPKDWTSGDEPFYPVPAPAARAVYQRYSKLAAAVTGPLTFRDLRFGEIPVNSDLLGDVVLARKDIGTAYHLAVVVDDAFQEISHVTRGEDLLTSTHVHRLLQVLLGLPEPLYLHHELVLDEKGIRLAKRNESLSIASLREAGRQPGDLLKDLLC